MRIAEYLYEIPISPPALPSRKLTRVLSGIDRIRRKGITKSLQRLIQVGVRKEPSMLDVIMLAIGIVFFALSVGYVVACDRL